MSMPSVEERLTAIETMLSERGRESARRLAALEGSIQAMGAAVSVMSSALTALTESTKVHVFNATCVNGGAKILQGGGAASGVAVAVFFIGTKLGWW